MRDFSEDTTNRIRSLSSSNPNLFLRFTKCGGLLCPSIVVSEDVSGGGNNPVSVLWLFTLSYDEGRRANFIYFVIFAMH